APLAHEGRASQLRALAAGEIRRMARRAIGLIRAAARHSLLRGVGSCRTLLCKQNHHAANGDDRRPQAYSSLQCRLLTALRRRLQQKYATPYVSGYPLLN